MTEQAKQRSTEYYGVGQSGYTAGRVEGDRALEQQMETRNEAYPKGADTQPPDGGEDERFTGGGGRDWAPDAAAAAKTPAQ